MCSFLFVLFFQSKVEFIQGHAQFTDDRCVEVNGEKYGAHHILIASGGRPVIPNMPGMEGETPHFLGNSFFFSFFFQLTNRKH